MAASSTSDAGGSSAITSGVRPIGGWLAVGGQFIPLERGEVTQSATKQSSEFSATVPLDGQPIDEAFWANQTPIDASIYVATTQGGGDRTELLMGGIDDVDIDYLTRSVHVTGRCKSADLHSTKSAEKFVNQKTTDIVSTIAGRVGLTVSADASAILAGKIFQIDWAKMTDGVSLASILHKLAELDGAKWYVQGSTLNYKMTGASSGSDAYVINYTGGSGGGPANADFMKLRITRRVPLSKSVKVTVKSWNTKKKQTISSTKTVGGTGGTVEYRYRVPELEQSHADKHATSKANDHARHELVLTAQLVGDATCNVAKKLRLRGTAFAQDFDMDTVRHEIGPEGYDMTISAKSAKGGRSAS